MTGRLVLCHAALALGAALLSAAVRTRTFRPSAAALDLLVGLLLPVVGPAVVLAGAVLELAFRRRGAEPAIDEGPLEDVPLRGRDASPVEELRIGTSVSPLAEVLAHGDLEEVDRALRRLVLSDRPDTLLLLRDALQSARLDVRIRARGLIVKVEDRLLAFTRAEGDALERARAYRKLACLSMDPVSLQQHLRGAVASYEQALARNPGSPAGGELGRLLLWSGDYARARQVLTRHLQRHPADSEARLARAQAALRAADLVAARRDCATLGLPALE